MISETPSLGRLAHVSLAVSALDPARTFLEDAFGYRTLFREGALGPQIRSITGNASLDCSIAQLERADDPMVVELIAYRNGTQDRAVIAPGRGAGGSHLAFEIDDLEDATVRLADMGAEPLGAVTDFNACRARYLLAPGGLMIELSEPRETHRE